MLSKAQRTGPRLKCRISWGMFFRSWVHLGKTGLCFWNTAWSMLGAGSCSWFLDFKGPFSEGERVRCACANYMLLWDYPLQLEPLTQLKTTGLVGTRRLWGFCYSYHLTQTYITYMLLCTPLQQGRSQTLHSYMSEMKGLKMYLNNFYGSLSSCWVVPAQEYW